MDDSLVYRKTGAGAAQLTATHGLLSPPARRVLILLDGNRTIAELADLFGMETVEREVAELEAKGFARRVDPDRPAPLTVARPTTQRPTTIGGLSDDPAGEDRVETRRGLPRMIALIGLVAAVSAGAYWYFGRAGSTEAGASPAGAGQAAGAATPGPGALNGSEADRAPASSATSEPAGANSSVSGPQIAAFSPTPVIAVAAIASPPRKPAPAAAAPTAVESPAPPATPVAPAPAPAPTPAAPARPADPKPVREAAAPKAEPAASADRPDATAAAVQVSSSAAPRESGGASSAAQAAPSPAAPAPVALAQPTLEPAPGPVQLHARKHESPQFPARALRAGVTQGHVEARVWVATDGTVEQVDIVRASPARFFDEEVRRALSLWTFDPPPRPAQELVELDFKP